MYNVNVGTCFFMLMKLKFVASLVISFCWILSFASCKKGGVDAPPTMQPPPLSPAPVEDDTKNYGPYASFPEGHINTLNVVYFLPNDYKGPLNQYQQRLSKMMLFMQDWFKNEMQDHGFGDKTFALLRSVNQPDFIKIIVVKGKQNRYHYSYEGGGSKAITEINDYFIQNPTEKGSEHTLVFIPSITGDGKGNNEGGVPFYGIGKYAFVLDYRYFDVSFFPERKDTANTAWIAGTIHELGHGLNLPHNTQKASDNFISLMHNHMAFESNHAKSRLTYADACLLNTNEVFNKSGHPYYKSDPQLEVNSLSIKGDEANINFRVKFTATPAITSVVIYNDPKTSAGDGDYNSVTWASSEIFKATDGKDSVAITMAAADILPEYRQHPFDMRVRFCHADGSFTVQSFKYTFANGMHADINEEIFEFTKLPEAIWKVTATSTNNGSPLSNLFDNNSNTIWHSKWQGGVDPLPHTIQINMDKLQMVKGIAFTARQDRSDGRPHNIKVSVSKDGTAWEEVVSGSLKDSPAKQIKTFTEQHNTQYIRIVIENVYAGTIANPQYTHLAGLELF